MDNQDWKRINEIFHLVLGRSDEEKNQLLSSLCQDEPRLRREVESLLEAHGEAKDFLVQVPEETDSANEVSKEELENRQIGTYHLLEELGRGGMGQVFLAEEITHDPGRRVALKVIHRHLISEDFLRRFRIEQQILGELNHAGIAHLYGGGTTEDGRPYFAMELVDGQAIDSYCDQHRLSVQERLRLFERVCDAVDHAHRRLVVHRDLKPSNILVTAMGAPKLLDFGIAKPLLKDRFAEARVTTRAEKRLLTPQYASPEQIGGKPVTVASDVYSLGVLLYQLLTGRFPLRQSVSVDGVFEYPSEVEVPRPSSVVRQAVPKSSASVELKPSELARLRNTDIRRLSRLLKGDLDNIVLRAIDRDPEQRYASADRFAQDLRRYRKQLPVEARPLSLAYRGAKFVKRHRFAVGAVAALFLLVSVFGVATMVQARALELQRDRAEAVASFLVGLFEVNDPGESRGRTLTANEILDRGAARLEDRLHRQPELRIELWNTIAEVHLRLGQFEKGKALLERALAGLEKEGGNTAAEQSNLLCNLGFASLLLGDYQQAEEQLTKALELSENSWPRDQKLVAQAQLHLGRVLRRRHYRDRARDLLRQAEATFRDDPGPSLELLVTVLEERAALERQEGRREESLELLTEALELAQREYGPEHPEIAAIFEGLGMAAGGLGQWNESRNWHQKALRIRQEILGPDHPAVGTSLHNLAILAIRMEDFIDADERFRETVEFTRRTLGEDHPNLGISLSHQAFASLRVGRFGLAETSARLGREIEATLGSADRRGLLMCRLFEGQARLGQGDVSGAEGEFETLYGVSRQSPEWVTWSYDFVDGLVSMAIDLGHQDWAAKLLREFEESQADKGRTSGKGIFIAALARARLAAATGDVAMAQSLLSQGEGQFTAPHPYSEARLLVIRSALVLMAGDSAKAEVAAREALGRAYASTGPSSAVSAQANLALGLALARQGRRLEARQPLEQAVAILPATHDGLPAGDFSARRALASLDPTQAH